ncbi:MAG: hypothetical protein PHC61_10770 [Chitinivibrionales bacterium]|nr:hypothetical protein [Chitinivibrionales bacterium]
MKFRLILITFAWVASGASIPVNGLLQYYTFDALSLLGGNQIKDRSLYGYTITASGAIQLVNDRFGNPTSAVLMDGSYFFNCLMPDTTVSKMIAGDFSMGFAMKATASSGSMTGRMDIMGMGDPYNNGFFLSLNNNRIRIFLGNHAYYDTPDTINDGLWHVITAVRSQGNVYLYIDGQLSDNGAYTGSITPIVNSFVIGKHGTKNESFYHGLLDDAFFYNKALAPDEVTMLYGTLSGVTFTLAAPADTFSTGIKPFFAWYSLTNAIDYAFEVSKDSLFSMPAVSVPLSDTFYTLSQPLSAGRYFMHIGANFDDRSPFFFGDPHSFIVK